MAEGSIPSKIPPKFCSVNGNTSFILLKEIRGSNPLKAQEDIMAEWLRRWTANPLGSARAGSNPVIVEIFKFRWCSWLSRLLYTQKVAGSNPARNSIILRVKRF